MAIFFNEEKINRIAERKKQEKMKGYSFIIPKYSF